MRTIYLNSKDPYIIGKTGESQKTALRVDVEEWYQDYPSGAGVLLFVRPNKVTYPLETNLVEHDGKHYLETIVTTNETKLPGWVVITAQWYDGETLLHGRTYSGKVLTSNGTNVTDGVMETTPTWVAELIDGIQAINETAATVQEAYDKMQHAVEMIDTAIQTAQQTVAQAEGYAETAEGYATTANTYKTAAAASATAAAASAEQAMDATPDGYATFVGSMATAYSTASGYAVGDYVLKDGQLYKCVVAIDEEGETWTAAHWTAVTAAGQLSQLSEENSNLKTTLLNQAVFTDKINRRSNNDYVCMNNQGTYTGSPTAPSLVGTKTYSYLAFTLNNKNNGVFFAKLKVSNIGSVDAPSVKRHVAYNNSPNAPAATTQNGTDTGAAFGLTAGSNTTIYYRFTPEYSTSEYAAIGIGFLFGTVGVALQIEGTVIDVTDYAYLTNNELQEIIDSSPMEYASLVLPAGSLLPSALSQIESWPVMDDLLDTVDGSIEPIQLSNIVNVRSSDSQIIVMRNNGTLTGSTTAPSLLGQQTYSYLGLAANNKNSGVFFAKITLKNIGSVNAPNLRTYVGYNNSPDASSSTSTYGTDIGDTFSLAAGASTTIYHRFSSEYNTSSYTGIAFGVLFGTVGINIQISGVIADVTDYANFSDEVLKSAVDDGNLKGYGLLLPAPNSEKLGDKTLQEVLALAGQSNHDYSLIAYGDSLTAGSGGSGVGYRYLDICKTELGAKNDLPLGYGGSGSKAIGFTAGAISGFVPPNTNSFALKYSDLATDISIANTRLNGKAVIIDGNEYIIGQTGATAYSLPETYTPASFYKEIVVKDSRYTADIYVIWVGTNDHAMKWDIINAFIEKVPHKQYVIMGLTKLGTDTSAQDETKAEELYGSHFFNTRVQIINNAFSVLGMTPTAEDTAAMSSGLMPPSLLSDQTHFNDNGYEAIGKLLAQHIKALGYSYQAAN